MTRFTYSQLEQLWINAGGNPTVAPLAAAVAMAESSGNSDALNGNTDGSIDRGLWQINSVHGSLSTLDIMGNAKAAIKVSNNGKDWTPWVTYNDGSYKKYLSPGTAPSQVPSFGSSPGAQTTATQASWSSDVGSAIGSGIGNGIAGAVKSIMKPTLELFLWGAEVAIGSAIIAGGVALMVASNKTLKKKAVAAGRAYASRGTDINALKELAGSTGKKVAQRKKAEKTARENFQKKAQREAERQQKKAQKEAAKQSPEKQPEE